MVAKRACWQPKNRKSSTLSICGGWNHWDKIKTDWENSPKHRPAFFVFKWIGFLVHRLLWGLPSSGDRIMYAVLKARMKGQSWNASNTRSLIENHIFYFKLHKTEFPNLPPLHRLHTSINSDRRNFIPTVATANQKATSQRQRTVRVLGLEWSCFKKMVNYGMFCA